ncbi:hypothetical protein HC928_22985 [bacterium]|nr:hypothetical protein [bacterium]
MTYPFTFDETTNAQPDDAGLIECPVIPVRGQVVYPGLVTPVILEPGRALDAAEIAHQEAQTGIMVAFDGDTVDIPMPDDLYTVGTEAAIGHISDDAPGDSRSVLVQGRRRVHIVRFTQTLPYLVAQARILPIGSADDDTDALVQTMTNLFQNVADLNEALPDEVIDHVLNSDDPVWLADFIVASLTVPLEERQRALDMTDLNDRLRHAHQPAHP